ncbi:MAG: insulinase family protein [Lachnospiraceae bacterium]|nr:insulinase family protein [Lachnospiraceae bacterium]
MILELYDKLEEREMKELHGKAFLFRHKKSGARLFLVSNDDENKVFTIGFRTPVTDNTGVPHIMEHSVLCGSEKFPAKDPFVELVKGSLNTFLNAMTYSDKTLYPVASVNDKDFQNLMDVYLDAVFHPNIYKNEKIFMQEGWHYELEKEEGPLTVNGVVYNEMKGAFSSPDSLLDRYIRKSLFPDTPYCQESGGDPEEILSLSYEQFLDFHRTYYHPSNSYIYLYGNMDMEEKLVFLDREYLSQYEKISVNSEIPLQKGFLPMGEYERFYPISEEEESEGKTYLSVNMVVGTSLNPRLYVAFQILGYVLLSASGAPIKQALVDAGIGTDIYGGYDCGILQPVFSVVAKNTDKEKKEQFLKVVRETLERLCAEGIGERALEAGINYFEFKYREADFGSYPKGLMYGLQCFDSWLYDEKDPFMHLEFSEVFAWLREKRYKGFFENLIKEYLLDSLHQTVIVLSPKKGMEREQEKALLQTLSDQLSAMSMEERRTLIKKTEELKAYQQEPSSREALETIPSLERKDIGKEPLPLGGKEQRVGDVPLFFSELNTNGIGYMRLAFDVSSVSREDWPYLGFLRYVLGLLNTDRHSYQELSNEVNAATGGLQISLGSYPVTGEVGSFLGTLELSSKAFYKKQEKALEFLYEIIRGSVLRDEKRLLELSARARSRIREWIGSSGHLAAVVRSGSYHSPVSAFGDATAGMEYYELLRALETDFGAEKEKLFEKLKSLCDTIFCRENLFVSYTGEAEGYDSFAACLEGMLPGLKESGEKKAFPLGKILPDGLGLSKKNEGFLSSSQVQYVARSGNFLEKGYAYTGAMRILQMILSYDYLWIQVRVKGGAYGVMSGFGRNGDSYFVSYRDPNLAKTNEVFEKVPDYLENFTADEREMTKYIIGTISHMDAPLTPRVKGSRNMSMYLCGVTEEMLKAERDQVLSASEEDIRALEGPVRAILAGGNLCVLGRDTKIEAERGLFETITRLL